MSPPALEPGTLLVAPRSEDADPVFGRSVVLVLDHEPNGIISGIVINRRLDQCVADTSALALLFIADPNAPTFWGGPLGDDPAILAQFSSIDGLEWFHLPTRMRRPFPLPDVGVISVAEHPEPFEDRIKQSRLFVGLCVWSKGQLEEEIEAQHAWQVARATHDDLFTPDPAGLWPKLLS
jgi:putative AlgH/UPF0301 family transcriptional regulator